MSVEYLDLLDNVLSHGKLIKSQKSIGAITQFGAQTRYDLQEGFPLFTTRDLKGSWRAIRAELLWIMSGSTNANDMHQYGSHLWDKWAIASEEKIGTKDGELGPTYGHQMRNFADRVDQLQQVTQMLRQDPHTRRAMISYWNLGDVEDMDGKHKVDVAPCISLLHFRQVEEGKLDLHMVQRSADLPVGTPFDVPEYALLLMLMAEQINLQPGTLVHTMSDAHIYEDQVPKVRELLTRKPYPKPTVTIADSPTGLIYDHRVEDFQLQNYTAHPAMKDIPIAV